VFLGLLQTLDLSDIKISKELRSKSRNGFTWWLVMDTKGLMKSNTIRLLSFHLEFSRDPFSEAQPIIGILSRKSTYLHRSLLSFSLRLSSPLSKRKRKKRSEEEKTKQRGRRERERDTDAERRDRQFSYFSFDYGYSIPPR